MAIPERLDLFWLKTKCCKKWKLLVYDAVITSKLFYGVETLEPTTAAANLLNVFQLKGRRKILNLHTTYLQRRNTNKYVYQKENEAASAPTIRPDRKIKPLTEVLEQRKLKLLGQVLRRERERQRPQHQVTFTTTSATPRESQQRRVGRPRQNWTNNNMKKAWEIISQNNPLQPFHAFDRSNQNMREQIVAQARL